MNTILYKKESNIAYITFNRPEALNALNKESLMELNEVIDQINLDETVDFVVFTGMGKAFIAGADISEMVNMNKDEAMEYGRFGAYVFRKIEQLEKITIAGINGYCLGGGNEIALACDFRIASEKAKFGQPEVSLGITPGFSGTQRLPRLIGVAKAKELLLTGKIIDANEANHISLVHSVSAIDALEDDIKSFVNSVDKNSMHAVLLTKKAIDEGIEAPLDEAIELENIYFSKCFTHEDQKEGMNAFLEKRKANFKHKEE